MIILLDTKYVSSSEKHWNQILQLSLAEAAPPPRSTVVPRSKTIGEWWVVGWFWSQFYIAFIADLSTSKEWDNLGFGLTTKDTNMVAASSADGQLWWVQNRGNFFMGI